MKFFENLIFILIATLFVATISVSQETVFVKNPKAPGGETGPAIAKIWVKTVQLNKQFPNPDSLLIGDTVWVQIAGKQKFLIANDSLNSQWAITVAAMMENEDPNTPVFITIKRGPETKIMVFKDVVVVVATIALVIVLIGGLILLYILAFKRIKKEDKTTVEVTPVNPPILEKVPDFNASKEEVFSAVAEATGNIYHRPFEIIGEITRGYINGLTKVWDAFGNTKETLFSNEPGYRAIVRFTESGQVEALYCLWECFNPVRSAIHSEFEGTFTPIETGISERIPKISDEESAELSDSIFPQEKPQVDEQTTQLPSAEQFSETLAQVTTAANRPKHNGNSTGVLTDFSVVGKKVSFQGEIPLTTENNKLLGELKKMMEEKEN